MEAALAPRRGLFWSSLGGLRPGAPAALAFAATAALVSEISSTPTADPGIYSSTWTPVTAVAGLVLGKDAFHGSFHPGPIALGLLLILVYGMMAAVPGVAFLLVTQGDRPGIGGAVVQGAAYGLALEIVVVNLAINNAREVQTLYHSMPSWGWWAAHLIYGALLCVLAARLRRGQPRYAF